MNVTSLGTETKCGCNLNCHYNYYEDSRSIFGIYEFTSGNNPVHVRILFNKKIKNSICLANFQFTMQLQIWSNKNNLQVKITKDKITIKEFLHQLKKCFKFKKNIKR